MPSSLFIGLLIVVAGIVAARFAMFEPKGSHRVDPAASGTLSASEAPLSDNSMATATAAAAIPSTGLRSAMGVRRPSQTPTVKLRWYQRLRSALLLVLITIGFGMVIGATFGGAALIVSFVLG